MRRNLNTSSISFITSSLANGSIPLNDPKDRYSYLRPVNMEMQVGKKSFNPKGCRSAACRTLAACLCSCKNCKAFCRYRGLRIVEGEDKVEIFLSNGKMAAFMTPEEYEGVRKLWERML